MPSRSTYYKDWYKNNKAKVHAQHKAYYYRHHEMSKAKGRERNQTLRRETLAIYSHGLNQCACCGDAHYEFLALDHINGGGNVERKKLNRTGMAFYRWLKAHGYPQGYQVLCHNCNMSLGLYKYCPHQRKLLS